MATELQQQVARHREEHLLVTQPRETPSLFFSREEAGEVDVESVFQAANSGLQALSQYDSRFLVFQDHLLHPSSQSLQRELLSPEERTLLDQRIASLLRLLMLFMNEMSAHKVLEYLVRRFRVHELNVDELLKCVISQHDTKIFARVVQLSNIDNSIWSFLSHVKTTGAPLSRANLVKKCRKDTMLLSTLASMTVSAVQLGNASKIQSHGSAINAAHGAEKVLSFFTATVVDVFEAAYKVSESHLRVLHPFIVGGFGRLNSTNDEDDIVETLEVAESKLCAAAWKKSSCIIIAEIAQRLSLAKPLVKSFVDAISWSIYSAKLSGYALKGDFEEILMTLTILCQHQEVQFSSKVLRRLFWDEVMMDLSDDVIVELQDLSSGLKCDVSPLVSAILSSTVSMLSRSNTHKSKSVLSPKVLGMLFTRCIASGLTQEPLLISILSNLLSSFIDITQSDSNPSEYQEAVESIIRTVAQRHPVEFDSSIQLVHKNCPSSTRVQALMEKVFNECPYRVPNTDGLGLLVGLNHASDELRVHALNQFAMEVPIDDCQVDGANPDVLGLCRAAFSSLQVSTSVHVLEAVCQPGVLSRLVSALSVEEVIGAVRDALHGWLDRFSASPKHSTKALVAIIRGICDSAVLKVASSREKVDHILFLHLLSTLELTHHASPDTRKSIKYCKEIVSAVLFGLINLSRHSFLLNKFQLEDIKAELEQYSETVPMVEFCWMQICSQLSRNVSHNIATGINQLRIMEGLTGIDACPIFCVSSLVVLIAKLYQAMSQERNTQESEAIFSRFLSVTMYFYNREYGDNEGSLESCNETAQSYLDAVVTETIQLAGSPNVTLAKNESNTSISMQQLCSLYINGVYSHGSRVRLLACFLEHLTEDADRFSMLLGGCLHSLFANLSIGILASLSAMVHSEAEEPSHEHMNGVVEEEGSDVHVKFRICLNARVGALHTMASYLRYALLNDELAYGRDVFSVLPALILCLRDPSRSIREAALMVVSELCNIRTDVGVTVTSGDKSCTYHSSCVVYMCQAISRSEEEVLSDEGASTRILKNEVLQAQQDKGAEVGALLLSQADALGWERPRLANALLNSCIQVVDVNTVLSQLTGLLSTVSSCDISISDMSSTKALGTSLLRCLTWKSEKATKGEKKRILSAIKVFLPSEDASELSAVLRAVFRSELGMLVTPNCASPKWIESFEESDLIALFQTLSKEIATTSAENSNDNLVTSLQAIPVPFSCAFDLLVSSQREISECMERFKRHVEIIEEVEDDDSLTGPGMATSLQRMCMYLDSVSPSLQQATSKRDGQHLSQSAVVLLDMLHALNVAQLNTVLSIAYCRGLLLELAGVCLGKLVSDESAVRGMEVKPSGKGRKKGSDDKTAKYSLDRIDSDLETIFSSLQLTSTTYVQSSSLKLVETLAIIMPSCLDKAVVVLSRIVAKSTSSKDNISSEDSNGFVGSMIRTTNAIRAGSRNATSPIISFPQEVLEPLFSNLSKMTFERRLSLVKVAIAEFDDSSVPSSIALILAHALAAYNKGRKKSLEKEESKKGDVFVLLSRSAQRKANSMKKTSESEEFFNLATKIVFVKPVEVQIQSVVAMTLIAKKLLFYLCKDELHSSAIHEDDSDDDNNDSSNEHELLFSMNALSEESSPSSRFDVSSFVSYANSLNLTDSDKSDSEHHNDQRNGAALVLMVLEFVLEFVENVKFHNSILLACGEDSSLGDDVQRLFVVFCEQLLELFAFATRVQHALAKSHVKLSVQLGGDTSSLDTFLRPSDLAKRVWGISLEVVHALQRLLDGPTFVVILQELIHHEHAAVRQRALQVLGDRLQLVASTKQSSLDSDLYLDLTTQLMVSIQQSVPDHLEEVGDVEGGLGVAQSALLGIDILARQFSSAKEWAVPMTSMLAELVQLSSRVSSTVMKLFTSAEGNLSGSLEELLKLLGSCYLCCGTLCSSVKMRSIPHLESLLRPLLEVMDACARSVLEYDASAATSRSRSRSSALLLRSCVSAVASLASELPSFFHPYLPRFLELATGLQAAKQAPEASLLCRDVEQCLFVITSKVPPRLAIPALLEASESVFSPSELQSTGDMSLEVQHCRAARLASFQRVNFQNLDRDSVASHLEVLKSICLVGLNYRFVCGDQSGADQVDDQVCQACVELCLKLTESELRKFLVEMLAVQSSALPADEASSEEKYVTAEWKVYSRSTVFFRLVHELNAKLKHIFVPLMGLVWQAASDHLVHFMECVAALQSVSATSDRETAPAKISKKRKLVDMSSASDQQSVLTRRELRLGCVWVLRSVTACCTHDSVGFIDKFRYEMMIRPVSSLFAKREAFESDEEYLEFALDLILPCMVQLAIAVGKDLLWKSLNHEVLNMTRSKQKSVKTAALQALQRLFSDIGEEYLVLLPECLPFLSEILEDSDSGIVALAAEVIQSIEDLSGESLDSYLR